MYQSLVAQNIIRQQSAIRRVPLPQYSKTPTTPPHAHDENNPQDKKKRVFDELKSVGMGWYGLAHAEAQALPNIIHDYEHITGVVYGRHAEGFAMLIATDRRAFFLDKKPLFIKTDEISYDIVGGVSYGKAGVFANVTLYTRIGDYTIGTMNDTSARKFVSYIESRCLEHSAIDDFRYRRAVHNKAT
ncbi:MAG: PH domain-containing protein [Candidatus Saccharibacteria bacterium]|nr:PH domain-containing protein [Candidatus Saccharibacteria bacterium]